MKIFNKYAIVMIAVSILMTGIFGCQVFNKEKNDDREKLGILALLAVADANAKANVAANARTPIALGEADSFVILTKSGVTNVGTSAITGNIGISPITGASSTSLTCAEVTGTIYTVDATTHTCEVVDATKLTTAVGNMETAYTDAAGRTPDVTELGAGNIGGLTITRGVYKWGTSVLIPTDVTLSGSADDVWIFQISQQLTVSNGVNVILSGGAQAKNVYWQTAGATTIGTTAQFKGTILSKTAINVQTGATVNGRMLAQTAVTLQSNTATKP